MIFDWSAKGSWPTYVARKYYLDEPASDLLIHRFYEHYSHIRLYHACRPIDVSSYYSGGICPRPYQSLTDQLAHFLRESLQINVPQSAIDEVVEQIGSYHEGKMFLALDKEFLLESAGHYAIYGSEYLLAMVNHLSEAGFPVSSTHLKSIGTPTVFSVALPVDEANEYDVVQLVTEINNHKKEKAVSEPIDFTFELSRPIPAAYIEKHEHPRQIKDPLHGYSLYTYSS